MDQAYFESLSEEDRATFYCCVRTGIDNPDSGLGCYAMTPGDYATFKPFFGQVIGDYHKEDKDCMLKHTTDWDTSKGARARGDAAPRSSAVARAGCIPHRLP